MLRLLLSLAPSLAACAPSSQETTMRNSTPVSAVSAAEGTGSARRPDSPTEAEGRRTLSTAFVRMSAGEHLIVELRDGRTIALRDVVVGPRDYCGVQLSGGRYCGGYGEIAEARPGAREPDL